jgi:hypothetical protein
MKKIVILCILNLTLHAISSFAGDRLLATGGVTQIEGSAGGGLTPWALISGYGTDTQIGASVFYTELRTNGGFNLSSGGVSVGLYNRVEVSLSQQKFGLSNTVPGESIRLDSLGVKVRVLGDAIYDQNNWMPQRAAGIQIKHNEDFSFVPKLLGAKKSSSVDVYVSATKLYLAAVNGRNLLLNATMLATEANQFGILGFGGNKCDGYRLEPAVSLALMLTDDILLGTEYRAKPNNLSGFKEDDAKDLFVTWFPVRNLSITAAYVDLGNIADKDNQRAWYLSGQISY